MKSELAPSFPLDIYIAGSRVDAERVCRAFCLLEGECVHVIDATFIYTGGAETGVKVGFINYPRFPREPSVLWGRATALAEALIDGMSQHSASIQGPDKTVWLTRRAEQ